MSDKSVLTIAVSNKTFIDMACNLAMSFLLWNDTSAIKFFLVTDCPGLIPEKLQQKINVVKISDGAIGEGFSSKLHIEQFLYTEQTLFIDADCLIYGSLIPAFNAFKGRSVSAIGYNRCAGTDLGFCRDIAQVMTNTGVAYFPLICGSVYYIENGEIASEIFSYAKSLVKSYHKIGLTTLRGKENEEPLIAISMAKFNQNPVNDTGLIKADRMFYEFLDANVIEGKARLWNNEKIPVPEYSSLKSAEPQIVHFNASYAELFEYESEVIRLRKVFLENRTIKAANRYAAILSVIPGELNKFIKDLFRPLYKMLFGYRKIKPLRRM